MDIKRLAPLALLLLPALAFAQGGLVPCSGPDCTVCDFWRLVDNVVRLLVQLSFAAGTIGIIAGGFFVMTAGGSPERAAKGREIITTAVVGVLIVLVAWVVLNTLFQFLAVGIEGWDPRFWNRIPACR